MVIVLPDGYRYVTVKKSTPWGRSTIHIYDEAEQHCRCDDRLEVDEVLPQNAEREERLCRKCVRFSFGEFSGIPGIQRIQEDVS